MSLPASGVRDAQHTVGRLPPVPGQRSAWLVRRAYASETGQTAAGAFADGCVMAINAVHHCTESPSAVLACVMQGRRWCKPRRR